MAASHGTFLSLFSDASRDPFGGEGAYAALLEPFNIDATATNPTPQAVRQMISASTNQQHPIALVAFVAGRLTPLFLPFRRDRAMGAPEHPATDNKLFAFEGDVIGTQGYLVELSDDTFNLVGHMILPTVGLVRGILAANLDATTVGPFAEGDANTSRLRTRGLVPVPHKYAALFLAHPGGVTARYYFETILPVIERDGMADICEPLTRFCTAAITVGAGMVSAVQIAEPRPPGRHVPLLEQAARILSTHLDGLRRVNTPEVNLQPLINTIVAGQQQWQQEQAVARLDRELKENASVSSWLGVENFNRLLRYCNVAEEAKLAPIWGTLARAPSKDRLTIFEGKVTNEFLALGAIYEQFTPSLFLLTQITSLKWGMLNPDALDTGSLGNAFLFTDSDVEMAQQINRQIDFIQQGGATPSYADAQVLLKSKVNLPGPDDSVRCVLRMLAIYRTFLPGEHPLVTFLQQHYGFMKAYDPGWSTYCTYVPQFRGLKGVYHLQWLSLKLTRYFGQLDCNVGDARLPDPHEIIDCIQEQRQWEPNLTETFTARYNLRAFLGLHSGLTKPSAVSTPSVASTIGSSVSSLTNASAPATPATVKGADTRVQNETFNEGLFGTYKTSALKAKAIRDKIKAGTIPALPVSKRDATKPMCLAWHTKGVCNANCPCLADHVAYSPEEYAPLVAWCRDHGYAAT